jgi:hypothetical protein
VSGQVDPEGYTVASNFAVVAELKGDPTCQDLLRTRTLKNLYEAATVPLKQRILNALNFHVGHMTMLAPPQYRYCVDYFVDVYTLKE